MNNIIAGLEAIIEKYKPLLQKVSNDAWIKIPAPGKWSKKQELGHTIDSALNNIRRFIVAQHEEQPYIVYQQNEWVAISNYQDYPVDDLIELWALLNKHICIILKNTSFEKAERLVLTQDIHSILWLAADYNKHLLHHLHHLLELEPADY